MSDWFGTHSTVPAVRAGLDLEMPGPSAWLGPDPGRRGAGRRRSTSLWSTSRCATCCVLMDRVGVLGGTTSGPVEEQEEDDPGRRAVAREVAAEGTVLLVNDGLLPLNPDEVSERGGDRAEREPARHGRRQLGGDAAPAPQRGRRAGRAPSRCRDDHI